MTNLPRLISSRDSLSEIDPKRISRSKNALSIARAEVISSYRSLIRSYGRDPTKRRPSSERIRQMISRGKLSVEHPAVLAYNLVSAATGIVLSGFDKQKISGEISLGSWRGEVELIDGSTIELSGKEILLIDSEKPLSIVPYMDTAYAKIDDSTREAIFVPHIVQGIPPTLALRSLRRLSEILASIGAKTVLEL